MQETWVQSLGQEDPLEKEVATIPVLDTLYISFVYLTPISPHYNISSKKTKSFDFFFKICFLFTVVPPGI